MIVRGLPLALAAIATLPLPSVGALEPGCWRDDASMAEEELLEWDLAYDCSVPNGSFERCTGCVPDVRGTPDNWTRTPGATGRSIWALREQDTGLASLRLECARAEPAVLESLEFPITVGADTYLHASTRAQPPIEIVLLDRTLARFDGDPAAWIRISITYRDETGAPLGDDGMADLVSESGWDEWIAPLTIPPQAATARITIGCETDGVAYIDSLGVSPFTL